LKYVQDGNPERSQFGGGLSSELGMCKFMFNFALSRLQSLKMDFPLSNFSWSVF